MSYFSYQECSVHVRTYTYAAEIWKKYVDFFLFSESILINK